MLFVHGIVVRVLSGQVRQTSPSSGLVRQMGKGYKQWSSIAGTDLKEHFHSAFARKVSELSIPTVKQCADNMNRACDCRYVH